MTVTKINGKYYEEIEAPITERQKIRERMDEINNDLIPNEKARRDVHIANIEKLNVEKEALKAKLAELNK